MSGLLTLDIATMTGWAWMAYPGAKIEWGHFRSTPSGPAPKPGSPAAGARTGLVGNTFNLKLTVILDNFRPEAVLYERPIMPGKTTIDTLLRLYGLAMVAEMACHIRGIRVFSEHSATVRKETTGHGHAKYPAIFAHLFDRGFHVGKDKDAAMAMIFLEYGLRYNLDGTTPRDWKFEGPISVKATKTRKDDANEAPGIDG